MARSRIVLSALFAGILITTGGCSSSPTEPSASASNALQARAVPVAAPAPEDEMSTLSSGYIIAGGRQASEP